MTKLRIAVDTGPLRGGDCVRGIGVYTRELLKALEMDGVDISHVDLAKYDLVHFTRFNPFTVSIPFAKPPRTKFVLTIYDLIPLIYPDHYPPGIRGWLNWQVNKYLIKKNIDAVITISETSKKDICRFIGINPNSVHVIYLAPRSVFKKLESGSWELEIRERYNLPKSFALYVGDINYNKNIPILVNACKSAKIPLVMCGKQAKEIESLDLNHPELQHLKSIDWSKIIRPGFVPDGDLVKIFNLTSVYIQPSLYEGFGLPLLEANAVGVPVVSAKTQASVEIAEDAALFADPKDAKNFSGKLELLLRNSELKNKLVKKGFENAKKHSWEKTAERTMSVYKDVSGFGSDEA